MRSVTSPTRRPFRRTGRRRTSFSFIMWIASMIEAFSSIVTGFRVIHFPTWFILRPPGLHAEKSLLDVVVAQQLLACPGQHDPAGLEHVGAMGDAERLVDVLLDQEDGH